MLWIAVPAALFLLGSFLVLLWDSGFVTMSCKRALFFHAFREKEQYGVRVSACTGTVRWGLRLNGEQPYRFRLSSSLSGGEASVEVRSGNSRLLLDAECSAGFLTPGPAGRCSLTFRFRSAEGSTALSWEIVS